MWRRLALVVALAWIGCKGGTIKLGQPSPHGDLSASEPPDLSGVPEAGDLTPAGADLKQGGSVDLKSTLDLPSQKSDLATTPGSCPADTVAFDTYCMDRYEAPNIEGALPFYFQTAPDGEKWCEGKGKRLCTEAEWKSACQGPNGYEYPYGNTHIKSACNDDKTWISPSWSTLGKYPDPAAQAEADRLYQGDPSGSRAMCISDAGVMDLTGNVAEWVRRSYPHPNSYDYVVKGCYWAGCYMDPTPDCNFTNSAHPPTFRSYEFGFRCCVDKS